MGVKEEKKRENYVWKLRSKSGGDGPPPALAEQTPSLFSFRQKLGRRGAGTLGSVPDLLCDLERVTRPRGISISPSTHRE